MRSLNLRMSRPNKISILGTTDAQINEKKVSSESKALLNVITNGDNALNENNERLLPNLPRSILEDDYFKQNLPPTYGTVSLPPSENDTDDRLGEFAFERDFKLCSKGYQELSNNLSAYGQSKVSWTASYQNTESIFNQPEEHDIRLGIKRGGLLSEPGYGQMNKNLSSIFQSKESKRETTMSENFFPSTECHKHSNNNNSLLLTNV